MFCAPKRRAISCMNSSNNNYARRSDKQQQQQHLTVRCFSRIHTRSLAHTNSDLGLNNSKGRERAGGPSLMTSKPATTTSLFSHACIYNNGHARISLRLLSCDTRTRLSFPAKSAHSDFMNKEFLGPGGARINPDEDR